MEIKKVAEVEVLLTRKQVAEILGCKENTLAIWKCTNRYNLPYVKIGKNIRYKLADVMSFIEKNTSK
jgi:predicted DNA-binding transcriptional regulator AlpA